MVDKKPQALQVQPQPTAMVQQNAHEMAVSSSATQAVATVRARYELARRFPRDMLQVRDRMLETCQRPAFAEVAEYSREQGKKQDDRGNWVKNFIVGPSIRFAEEAARQMGSIDVKTFVVHEDDDKVTIRIQVIDIETNSAWEHDVNVSKTVERRKLKNGQQAISERLNSWGDTVYLVEATEAEIESKVANLRSKAARSNIMRLIPGDIVEECIAKCRETTANADAADPKAALKKIADAFSAVGIQPKDLIGYLRHPIEQTTPAELIELRGLFTAIRDGSVAWPEVMADRQAEVEVDEKTGEVAESKTQKILNEKKARQEARAAKAKEKAKPKKKEEPEQAEPEAKDVEETAAADVDTKAEAEAQVAEAIATADQGTMDFENVGPPAMSGDDKAGF